MPVRGDSPDIPGHARVGRTQIICGLALGLLFLAPLLMYGPVDDEEGALGVFASQIHYKALLHGQWLFWLNNLGFGTPLPIGQRLATNSRSSPRGRSRSRIKPSRGSWSSRSRSSYTRGRSSPRSRSPYSRGSPHRASAIVPSVAWVLLFGLSVKTPWQLLRGVVQGGAEVPGRFAAAFGAWS